jgi:creatinine amidohydrolase
MPRKVQWERMLKHELDEAIAAAPLAYLSFGLCEPHGLYNPLGLDGLKAYGICVRAAEAGGGIVAPPSFWHIHEESEDHQRFLERVTVEPNYLTSVPADLFRRWYLWQLRACVNAGCRAVIAVSGHYGGVEFNLKYYAKLFQRHVRPIPIWGLADWEVIFYRDEVGVYNGSHASLCETAQLSALCPGLPQLDHKGLKDPDPYAGRTLAGLKENATKERGEKIVESQVRNLVAGAKRMLAEGPQERPKFIEFDEMAEAVEKIMRDKLSIPPLPVKKGVHDYRDKYIMPKRQNITEEGRAMPEYVFADVELLGS